MAIDQIKYNTTADKTGSQDDILIISGNSSGTAQLTNQFAEKGYRIVDLRNLPDFKLLQTGQPKLLIILADCPEACVTICEHLRLIDGVSNIPLICISESRGFEKPVHLESIYIEEFLPKSAAFDWLESRVRYWRNKAPSWPVFQERRRFERREPVNLSEHTQAAQQELVPAPSGFEEAPCAQENNDKITMLVISPSERLSGKLLTLSSEAPVIQSVNACIHSPELIPAQLESIQPDIVVFDSDLSCPAPTEWLKTIRKTSPKVKIILLYDEAIPDLLNEIVEFGISGLIKTDAGSDIFRKAVRIVHRGELWLPHSLISQIIATYVTQNSLPESASHTDLPDNIKTSLLNQREQRVIDLIAQGLTNRQIAKQLCLSPETIKKKLANIFEKTGVRSRSQLVSIYAASLKDLFAKNTE